MSRRRFVLRASCSKSLSLQRLRLWSGAVLLLLASGPASRQPLSSCRAAVFPVWPAVSLRAKKSDDSSWKPSLGMVTQKESVLAARPAAEKTRTGTASKGTTGKVKLANVKPGDVLDGRVQRKSRRGASVDVGCETFAMLKGAAKDIFRLEQGELLQGLEVTLVDVGKRHLDVSLPNLPQLVDGRTSKLLQDLRVGTLVDGVLVKRAAMGILFDIGTEAPALLRLEKWHYEFFGKSVQITGLQVTKVDAVGRTVDVKFPGLGEFLAGKGYKSLKELGVKVGDTVFGKVVIRTPRGLRVRVFPGIEAILKGEREKTDLIKNSESLHNLVVSMVDYEKNSIDVELPDIAEVVAGRSQEFDWQTGRKVIVDSKA